MKRLEHRFDATHTIVFLDKNHCMIKDEEGNSKTWLLDKMISQYKYDIKKKKVMGAV